MSKNIKDVNMSALARSFMEFRYLHTFLVNATTNEYVVLQTEEPLKCLSATFEGDFEDYGVYLKNALNHIHPMFKAQYSDYFSQEALLNAYKEHREPNIQVLYMAQRDNKYHWVTQYATPVSDGVTDQAYFIVTSICTDKEKAASERNRQFNFNLAVLNELMCNYVLIHVVDLNSKMSKLVHTKNDPFYYKYESRFTSHFDMINNLYNNFIAPEYKKDFKKFTDYEYIQSEFERGKERITLKFLDDRGLEMEISVSKYPDYSEESPIVIFTIKEINKYEHAI